MNTQSLAWACCLVLIFTTPFSLIVPSNAQQTQPTSDILKIHHVWHQHLPSGNKTHNQFQTPHDHSLTSPPFVLSAILSFIASSVSSASGMAGGSLYILILTLVAKQDLKTALSLSSFMVTGGSLANVLLNMCWLNSKLGGKSLIDYDIAISLEPCMLLGVSVGVICNRAFPEWLVTLLLVIFLVWSLAMTFKKGFKLWKTESEEKRRNAEIEENRNENFDEPHHLGINEYSRLKLPWVKLGVLLLVWLSFFSIYFLRGNSNGQSIIHMKPCGVGYWILSSVQIPLAVILTATWIVFREKTLQHQTQSQQSQDQSRDVTSKKLLFPLMALLGGILGGIFGGGGGMVIGALLLHVGIAPEITAATTVFMVLFSSSMATIQYALMGIEDIKKALILSTVSFVASLVGLLVMQRTVRKYKRASLIVFSLCAVMALAIVLMTSFGAIDIWRDYKSGTYMGFKPPCINKRSS